MEGLSAKHLSKLSRLETGQGKYGLIKPAGKKPALKNVFGNEDSEEVSDEVQRQAAAEQNKRDVQKTIADAQAQDPTIFLYDEVVEEKGPVRGGRIVLQHPVQETAKYQAQMQIFAARRKREQEQAEVRKIRREVEEDEAKYGKKEKYMTQSYLDELKKKEQIDRDIKLLEEKEARDSTRPHSVETFMGNLFAQRSALSGGRPSSPPPPASATSTSPPATSTPSAAPTPAAPDTKLPAKRSRFDVGGPGNTAGGEADRPHDDPEQKPKEQAVDGGKLTTEQTADHRTLAEVTQTVQAQLGQQQSGHLRKLLNVFGEEESDEQQRRRLQRIDGFLKRIMTRRNNFSAIHAARERYMDRKRGGG
ncbi:hypothetical protein PAPYR_9437 [Paratrimastix pyriformis]|uniref:Nuclear speckle splicing regulatory protein 1 N-terminal domain-containing protein n=1 Tax=Paratrimastix pyriformis TaxID=342808 RepID=A0ABQ8UB53_9EUKA|nr:hypothetical protein PAPYR_9437 [Paratrimastix pyriformis]